MALVLTVPPSYLRCRSHDVGIDEQLLESIMRELNEDGIKLVILILPHNTTLVTQPLDNGPYGVYKRHYNQLRSAIESCMRADWGTASSFVSFC